MTRHELEHIIRAAGEIVRDNELIVFGSQAILGSFPDAPDELLASFEVDIYPKNRTEAWGEIDYAHGVSPEVATLPNGWEERLVPCRNENTRGITGWCLEVYDLAISKLAAGREKDITYLHTLIRHAFVNPLILQQRLNEVPVNETRLNLFRERLQRIINEAHQ